MTDALLIIEYFSPMRAMIRRYIKRGHDTEDCLHDAFLVAVRQFSTMKSQEPKSINGWLCSVAKYTARRHNRENALLVPCGASSFWYLPDQQPLSDVRLIREQELLELRSAVARLPRLLRVAIRAWMLADISSGRIRKNRVDKPVASKIRNNLVWRAKRELKKILVAGHEQ